MQYNTTERAYTRKSFTEDPCNNFTKVHMDHDNYGDNDGN